MNLVIIIITISVGKPAYLYEEANPDWFPSVDLGYSTVVPDESRYARFVQRSVRRQELLSSQDVECEMDHFVPDQHSTDDGDTTVQLIDASCQTDKELSELTVLQRKEYIELQKENSKK